MLPSTFKGIARFVQEASELFRIAQLAYNFHQLGITWKGLISLNNANYFRTAQNFRRWTFFKFSIFLSGPTKSLASDEI